MRLDQKRGGKIFMSVGILAQGIRIAAESKLVRQLLPMLQGKGSRPISWRSEASVQKMIEPGGWKSDAAFAASMAGVSGLLRDGFAKPEMVDRIKQARQAPGKRQWTI